MVRGLTPTDQAIWKAVTKDVTPLGKAPVRASEGLPVTTIPAPRDQGYDPRLDLHGVTVHKAFGLVQEHIYQGAQRGYKRLLVITGRSGQINQELPRWLEQNTTVRSIKQLSNGGSWEVLIKPAT